ncbi:imidazole glycerol phosphate synthase subunit HisH [Algoriphagus jejuensis]|uniref:Imidazole glycerol phosphate synthase subunit HisH n=1 Tax=Algoriphagus jejuensis TaxID=419934 RepID=A0ABN1N4U3_9BACT
MITIVDYGLGNLGSIGNMFKRIGVKSQISNSISEISGADKILLPGVGSFDHAINEINQRGLAEVLNQKALIDKVPFLGICLGMQLLTKSSEEGNLSGLGYVDAKTLKFRFPDKKLKIPHMGWNVTKLKTPSQLTFDMDQEEQRFYFVHSYYVKCESPKNSIAETIHGLEFSSMIQNENIYGAQFHPEKSHRFGMKLFANFSKI